MQRVETLIWAAFPPPTVRLLTRLGEITASAGRGIYLIGGVVRDMIMHRPIKDLDIMVDGDVLALVGDLKNNWSDYFVAHPSPGKLVTFEHYQTAKLSFTGEISPGITAIDFSRARKEVYSRPAAKPDISPGSVYDDLARRDFSINSLAIALDPAHYGELVDYFSGVSAISDKQTSILHERSFVDDPARLIRGVRFNSRFDFQFTETTSELARQAIAHEYLTQLNPARLYEEFRKALREHNPQRVLYNLDNAKLLTQIYPGLRLPSGLDSGEKLRLTLAADPGDFYLVVLTIKLSEQEFLAALSFFVLGKKKISELMKLRTKILAAHVF